MKKIQLLTVLWAYLGVVVVATNVIKNVIDEVVGELVDEVADNLIQSHDLTVARSVASQCIYKFGDGTGGSEKHIGNFATTDECASRCLALQKTDKRINGATVDAATGKKCYCEYGMNGRNGNKSWKSCFLSPSYTCDYKVGDGIGGTENLIGTVANADECVSKCLTLRLTTSPSINGATVDSATSKRCYCEHKMNNRNTAAKWKSCFINIVNLNGGYSVWSDFSHCSASCGTGTRVRYRTCTNPVPAGKGEDCDGKDNDVEPCKERTCEIVNEYLEWSPWTSCSRSCGEGIKERRRACKHPTDQSKCVNLVGQHEMKKCNDKTC